MRRSFETRSPSWSPPIRQARGLSVTPAREARDRNLLWTLMDNLPAHIFVKDTQSRFVIANAAYQQLNPP